MQVRPNDALDVSGHETKPVIPATDCNLAIGPVAKHAGSKVIRFDDLAKCGDEVWIEHAGQLYRLRKTRHQKLVLSK
ncbi:Hemin uptake protein hemP [Rubripirellula obstinata]|uniref:Hemin uptake protein hemP n=1 Tax=Rubripirellula obstinata TaxID=406547 RepID=A0A5B1CG36_9BACT|nr:hemin uptake protein HemP [Rubripirellula obstinata]KAA1260157.1 Hemin uptake protein hemP [Rubripirellula obstinata]